MIKDEDIRKKIEEVIDNNASLLVGELLRNLEVLDGEGLSFEQIKSLYKKLIKEKVYQNARYLKKIINVNLNSGSVIFRQKPKEKNNFSDIPDETITKGL